MSDFLEVHCPSCGRNQMFSTAGVAREGAWGNCGGCGEEIFITPDGAEVSRGAPLISRDAAPAEPAVATAAPSVATPAQGDGRLSLKMPSGRVETLSTEAIEHGIQAGQITPWDLVSDDGEAFEAVSRHPALAERFFEGDFVVRLQNRCYQHKERLPAETCRRCGRSYCAECRGETNHDHKRCPACDGLLSQPDPRLSEPPPWKRMKEVVMVPIEGGGWMVTLALAAILWLSAQSVIAVPLLAVGLALIILVVDRSSRGERVIQLSGGETDLAALAKTAGPALVVTLLLALPFFVAQRYLASGLGTLLLFAMGIAVFAYYPMALGQLTLSPDKQTALDPKRVVAAIVALKEEYLLCLTLLLVAGVGAFGVQTLAGLVPGIGSILGGVARAYGLVLLSYLLGWCLYMNRERILAAR